MPADEEPLQGRKRGERLEDVVAVLIAAAWVPDRPRQVELAQEFDLDFGFL